MNNAGFFEYTFFNGKRIARRDASNNVSNYFADDLGTTRVLTNAVGTILDDSDFYPFGGERPITSSSGNAYKFTGKERDSESGLDNFGARYNSSNLGRFMSADDVGAEDHQRDPQGLNLYSYVQNNPMNVIDPDGHDCVFVIGNTAGLQRGDCSNAPGSATNVTYVPGTVDEKSGQYNPDTGTLTVHYTPYGETGTALSVIGGITPTHPGPTEFEAFASRIAVGADNVNAFPVQVGIQVGAGAIGRAVGAGIEALFAARALSVGGRLVAGTVFNEGRGLLQGEAVLTTHAAEQAAERGVTEGVIK